MLPRQTTILIVGAGPTGLAAALSLAHQGCKDLVIVDAVERQLRPHSSRAIAIHAATLEALEALDCTSALLSIGIKAKGANNYTSNGFLFHTEFGVLEPYTEYPFTLLVSQYSTERILEAKLEEMEIRVARPYRLVGLDDDGNEGDSDGQQGLVATFENGEKIRAKYVIGADGARSTVRQLIHVGYSDPDGESIDDRDAVQIVLADVTYASPPDLSRDHVYAQTSEGHFFLSIPVPRSPYSESYDHLDEGIFRIGFTVPKVDGPPPSTPGADYFQSYMEKLRPSFLIQDGGNMAKIDKMLWSTRFRIHAAIADKFLVRIHAQEQREKQKATTPVPRVVLLIGDAAHIHSPVGGQGMNLGLRDAIGLGPVLANHIQLFPSSPSSAEEADKLLEEYAAMRRARAITTVRFTKRAMASIAFIGSSGWAKYFVWLVKLAMKVPVVKRTIVWQASGLGNR